MGNASIPVDLVNPGQVFACLGFLEAADSLCGPAEGGFGWDETPRFGLLAAGAENPVAYVLEFLTGAKVTAVAPDGSNIAPKFGIKNEAGGRRHLSAPRAEAGHPTRAAHGLRRVLHRARLLGGRRGVWPGQRQVLGRCSGLLGGGADTGSVKCLSITAW